MRIAKIIFPVVIVLTLLGWLIFPVITSENHARPSGEKKQTLGNSGLAKAVADPDSYQLRPVDIKGRISADPAYDSYGTHLQVWARTGSSEADIIVKYPANLEVTQGDYIRVKGKIEGPFVGETTDGAKLETIVVEASSIESARAEDVVAPAQAVWAETAGKKQREVGVTIEKVEFAAGQTRFYLKVDNRSDHRVIIQVSNSFVRQAGKLFEPKSELPFGYEEVPVELAPGGAGQGVIVFPSLDRSRSLNFNLPVIGEDWESGFDFRLGPQ